MAKNRVKYREYTAANLKSRATIPNAADITQNANDIDCVNITTGKIRNSLISGINTVKGNATHANVNVWSGFGPTVRTVVAGLLTNSAPTSGMMGDDFAGYNHAAVAPFFDSTTTETIYIIPNEEVVFDVVANIGEVLYTDIVTREDDALGVAFSVWDGSTLIDNKVKALSGLTDEADFSTNAIDRITKNDIIATTDFTCKIEIIDSATTYDYIAPHVICQVPGIEEYTVSVIVMDGNHVELSAPTDWAFEGTDENFNSFGHLVFEALMHRVAGIPTDVAHVQVIAYVLDKEGIKVTCDTEIYHGGPTDVIETINVHVFRDPTDSFDLDNSLLTSGYGYKCVVFVNEHPA